MIMDILTGSGGDSVLFARYTGGGGGFCPRQQKIVGGGFCPGGILSYTRPCHRVIHKNMYESNQLYNRSQVSVYTTIGPSLWLFFREIC